MGGCSVIVNCKVMEGSNVQEMVYIFPNPFQTRSKQVSSSFGAINLVTDLSPWHEAMAQSHGLRPWLQRRLVGMLVEKGG